MPGLLLGQVVPDFEAETSDGKIKFHDWLGGSWAMLCSHPADFTPVCCTELGAVQNSMGEFKKRGVKVIALSCDDVEKHKGFIDDISAYSKTGDFGYPIIADPDRKIADLYGMMDPVEKDGAGLPLTARAFFVIGPDKKLKLSILYPATTGRNIPEILRVIDSLLLTAKYQVATPVNWESGKEVMVVPSVKSEELEAKYPKGVRIHDLPSGKAYLRFTPQPDL